LIRIRTRAVAALAGAAAFVALGALPAAAHVTVNPKEAEQGGFASLTFRVPNERDNAKTNKLEVVFPETQPLASVRVKPHPGWTYENKPIDNHGEQVSEVVGKITWTAQAGHAIGATEFEEFQISGGRMPEAEQMVFKAIQTYDNGEVVRWIEEKAAGATAEPEKPAPLLKLVPKKEPADIAAAAASDPNPRVESEAGSGSGTATLALIVSIVALLLGAGGLASGLAARRRSS